MQSFDILIIGNGILGLSAAHALFLEDPRLSIAIIGPNHRSGGATIAAGAMLGCFGEVTKYSLQSKPAIKKLELSMKAKSMWDGWMESINMESRMPEKLKIHNGTFVILNTKSGILDNENYEAIQTALNENKEPHENIDPRDISSLNPAMNARPLKTKYLPKEGYINSFGLVTHLQSGLGYKKNIHLIDDEVVKIQTEKVYGEKAHLIYTKLNRYHAKVTLLAAGAFSQKIIDSIQGLSSKVQRIFSGVGCSFILNQPAHTFNHVIRTPNRAGACGVHVMGYSEDSIYVGASNYLSSIPKMNNKVRYIYYLLQYAMEQIDQRFQNAEVMKCFTGCRPVPLDTFPLLGETSIPGFWILSGTYRDGLQLSPLLATAMAKKILNKSENILDETFNPERFPIQTMSKAESINQFVNQTMASAYEHAIDLPKNGWDEQLPLMVRANTERLYKELDYNFGLPVEIILMLEREPHMIPIVRQYLQSKEKMEK